MVNSRICFIDVNVITVLVVDIVVSKINIEASEFSGDGEILTIDKFGYSRRLGLVKDDLSILWLTSNKLGIRYALTLTESMNKKNM